MGKLCDTMKDASTGVWNWFFPKKLDVPDCVIEMLEAIYPTVDWSKVTFYEGLPNLFGLPTLINKIFGGGGLSQGAITLPDTKSLRHINIYLTSAHKDWCACGKDLDTYVHEGAHVLQIEEWLGGWGLGLGRPFIALYLACFIDRLSYSNSPFEVEARRVENAFMACCNPSSPPCDCSTNPPTTNTAAINALKHCAGLVQTSSGMNFREMAAKCTPGIEYLLKGADRISETLCKPFKNLSSTEWTEEWAEKASRRLLSMFCTTKRKDVPGVTHRETDMQPPENEPRPGDFNRRVIFCLLGLMGAGLVWVGYGAWWVLRGLLCGFGWLLAGVLYVVYGIYYAVWLILWTLISIVAEILFLLVELIGLIITGIMWIVTGILCALEWLREQLKKLWEWFKEQLVKACDWAVELEKKCAEWETKRKKQCEEWKDESYSKCVREEDRGYRECAREEDRGYRECARREDRGYSRCCDWWPCSWACSALVWVSNIVCVAWTWVSNIVCVAWTWVSNIVCVAWTWVSHMVCVAWTWIVSKSCKAFTWVVKKVTCR